MLPPRKFIALMDGRAGGNAVIAQLLLDLGRYIGALTTDVSIGKDYAQKLIKTHDLRYEHFGIIQATVDDGWCFVEARGGKRHLLFVYDSPDFHKHFKLVLKSAKTGNEIWVNTFHKLELDDVKSVLKRKNIEKIRDHVEMQWDG